jgi:hypothetical protein
MVKPWTEWIMIFFQKSGWKPPNDGWLRSNEMYEKRVKDLTGDDGIPFKVTGVSIWLVNEVWADKASPKIGSSVEVTPSTVRSTVLETIPASKMYTICPGNSSMC